MTKSLIDYLIKTFTLILLTMFMLVFYLRDKEHSVLLLIGTIGCGVMAVLYSIFYFKRRRLPATDANAKRDLGHIKPRNFSDGNQNIRAVQVSNSILEKITIGKNYYYGKGLPKDFSVAFNYLFDGAYAGDSEAQMLVGRMFQYGQGVSQNLTNAITWLEAASFQGNREAEYQLGRIYAQQYETKEDPVILVKAHYFLQTAANQGSSEAHLRLREFSKKHPLTTPLNQVSAESFFDIEHNPFIRAICIDQLNHEPVPQYTIDDVKKCFKFFGLKPTMDLDRIHHQYMSFMIKCHPDRTGGKVSSRQILVVRRAYDILEHYISTRKNADSN